MLFRSDFTVPGAGLVVTGTIFSGTVRTDETVILSPQGIPARVRTIHAQNRTAGEARAGQRSALNITGAGLEKGRIHRGDWLLAEAVHLPVPRLDARIRVLKSEVRPLKHWTPVHVHIGAADVTGRVAVLEGRSIEPGATALAQLALDHPVGALRGDRCILRDQSARRTVAGGRVIDPFAPSRGRARPDRLAALAAMEKDDPAAALQKLLEISSQGVELGRFARAWNLGPEPEARLRDRVPMVRTGRPGAEIAIAPARWQELRANTLEALARWHQSAPDRVGPGEESLRTALAERVPATVFITVVHSRVDEGAVVGGGMFLRLPEHAPVMAPADRRMWEQVQPILETGHTKPPVLHEIASTLAMDPAVLRRFLIRAAGLGTVVRVAANRFMLPEAASELAALAAAMADELPDGVITAAAFRDRSGIGRNLTIQVLEFFDRAGLTRRTGDARRVLKPAEELFRPGAA